MLIEAVKRAIHAKTKDADWLWAFRHAPLLPLNNQRYLPKKRDSKPRVADRIAAMSCAGHAAGHGRPHHDVMPPNLSRARLRKQYRNSGPSRDVLLNRRLLDATETYGTDRKLGNRLEKPVNPRIAINKLSRAEFEALLRSAWHNRVL
jgi:hypothetical protein